MDFALTASPNIVNPIENDIAFDDSGQIHLLSGAESVAQHLRIRFRFFLGEWFLDLREGVPYLRDIFVKIRNETAVRAVFRSVILSTPGVDRLLEFDFDFDRASRQVDLSFRCLLDSGEILSSDAFGDFVVEV